MPEPLRLTMETMSTPIGEMVIVADENSHLRAIDWTDFGARMLRLLKLHYGEGGYALDRGAVDAPIIRNLKAYFDGDLSAVDTLPVTTGGTEFQRKVWQALREIPHGKTLSYRALSDKIGQPKAVRAVGLANGANPVGIVVPCHRVIGSSGDLTGYGGGMERKQWLLAHEGQGGITMQLPF